MNNFPREFMAVDGTMGNQIKFSERKLCIPRQNPQKENQHKLQ
jgi:hypothetical protein